MLITNLKFQVEIAMYILEYGQPLDSNVGTILTGSS